MPNSPSASQLLDREFLEIRARLLQLAAALDRIDRAEGSVADDPRRRQVAAALERILAPQPDRTAAVQMLFSLPYLDDWRQRFAIADVASQP